MRILLVGALSWNPERIRSLAEQGHQLWGLWSRSMGWDQGPYAALDDCVQTITLDDAARTIAEQRIECVYSLFQVYDAPLWDAPSAGVEHDVWTLLRALLAERAHGTIDVPIVFHWGFDVHNLDGAVVRALDGQIFCNVEQWIHWTTSTSEGGRGLELFDSCDVVAFLDGDRPKLEFMNDDFSERLSAQTGEIHTVCVGRPFNIDSVALARRGIHLHVYGNGFDDVSRMIVRDVGRHGSRRDLRRVREFVHLHPSLQPIGRSWADVRAAKSQWVREFSQYDAGWSYIGAPYPWRALADRSAIPNRVSTYVLAGLPVISDRRPGCYRYDELTRLDINIDLVDSDYEALHARLAAEAARTDKRANALDSRFDYSFDASIEALLGILELTRKRYFDRPLVERRRAIGDDDDPLIRLSPFDTAPAQPSRARRLPARIRAETIDRHVERRTRRLSQDLGTPR